ncbi:16S rRNA (uracil(1498)-N(3))-methyltransferase [Candidatus Electronema sp. PJ]|uniref:16S rRNA (uracil(1498)-N(3))-methyltransferase n=1 Tax=Candidatus Electronema sp. PJ TaxID=3401572 RepID=UPI003AA8B6AD
MNLVLLAQEEIEGDIVQLTDFRAEHIRKILGLAVGDTLRLGIINGKLGQGKVLDLDMQTVTLKVQLDREPPPPPLVELILALPRPIMLQRILKQAATLGVRRIHLLRSAKVEKSFFHSPVLLPHKLQELLLEGLQQAAVDTRLPEVCIHPQFKIFMYDLLPAMARTGCRLLAHPGLENTLPEVWPRHHKESILLAIGPEGGWNNFEVACFQEQGFAGFTMGSRILHVDTAVTVLLGQIDLLQRISSVTTSAYL